MTLWQINFSKQPWGSGLQLASVALGSWTCWLFYMFGMSSTWDCHLLGLMLNIGRVQWGEKQRKDWTYTNLHLSLPLAIQPFLLSRILICSLEGNHHLTSRSSSFWMIIWGDLTNINKNTSLSLHLIRILGEVHTFINLKAFSFVFKTPLQNLL